jgi:hypothetical protein
MMPDVTITVPELEIKQKTKTSDIKISPKKHPDLAPTNPSNSSLFFKKLSGASPSMEFS